ncbi:MAG: MinD/ParA family protein [Acidobacteria bacterium]|nr:MinD/ParA family protein [Acidobacteriota bacterium]
MTHTQRQAGRGSVIAITSGKGGVGKTNVVINLAAALARRGYRVGIIDADFGLGNIDVMLGLAPVHHLGHFLNGSKRLEEIIIDGPLGIRILPASSGFRELTNLTPAQWRRVGNAIRRMSTELDFLFVDTAAGISDNVVELLRLVDRTIVVTSFDPAAIVDAYAMIKILTTVNPTREVGVVVSAARDADEAGLVFRQLDLAATRFLERSLRYAGSIVFDPAIRESLLVQRPVVDHQPQAPASRCFRILASRLAGMSNNGPGKGIALAVGHRPDEEPLVEETQCA